MIMSRTPLDPWIIIFSTGPPCVRVATPLVHCNESACGVVYLRYICMFGKCWMCCNTLRYKQALCFVPNITHACLTAAPHWFYGHVQNMETLNTHHMFVPFFVFPLCTQISKHFCPHIFLSFFLRPQVSKHFCPHMPRYLLAPLPTRYPLLCKIHQCQ